MAFRAKKSSDVGELYEYAVGALGRRMRSVAELKRLLRQRAGEGHDAEVSVEAVILKLKQQKYLNDSQFAAAYSSYRKENERFGRLRVISDLKAKGVHGDVIEKAVTTAYEGVNEEQLAREFLRRKRLTKPRTQKEAAKIFRTLHRAGFGTRTSISILKKWDVDEETISALETESADR